MPGGYKTEIQVYGYTAVVYSNYAYELETGGQRINQAGLVRSSCCAKGNG